MVFVKALSVLFTGCILMLACSRAFEAGKWHRENRADRKAGRIPAQRFAARLPLWVAALGIAGGACAIGISLGSCQPDGSLAATHMVAVSPLFVASAIMVLIPAAGFYDVEIDCSGPGHLVFRRWFIAYRRVRVSRVRFARMRGGTLYVYVPNRKRPYPIDNFARGYGRLLALLARENIPIVWDTVPDNRNAATPD